MLKNFCISRQNVRPWPGAGPVTLYRPAARTRLLPAAALQSKALTEESIINSVRFNQVVTEGFSQIQFNEVSHQETGHLNS